ncbi:MAG: glutathione S-transferase family protein [Rhodobacteraceae bacterium]|nr:glutathione S-transferase family protein [Paracoccaceae bacterium]MCF8516791.1 glutathione S-transferase family protein [Paracoccaceae bacterium]MCF8521088.1 glutathione S-transferase family protein [Paracoccaceae bacterium]
MLTLFHAPKSRSTRIVTLIEEMGIADQVDVRITDIPRMDGTGAADPANPHPEHKVPALLHDGTLITETAAVMLYLTALFPDSGLAPKPGDPRRGDYLTWLFWYGSVMEPVLILEAAGLSHPYLTQAIRDSSAVEARLKAALSKGPWLLGDRFSAADILVHSPYAWFGNTPDDPLIADWVARCMARPARLKVMAAENAALAA